MRTRRERTRPGGGQGREADKVGRRTRSDGWEADTAGRRKVARALRTAFAVGSFAACDRFVTGRLRPGETFDTFLAGCVSSRFRSVDLVAGEVLACAFVTGVMAVLTDEIGVAGRC